MLYFCTQRLNGAYMDARRREDSFIWFLSGSSVGGGKQRRRFATAALNELR